MSSEDCFRNVIIADSEMIITRSVVYFWEMTSTLKLVKQLISLGDEILMLDCNLIQLSIVNAHSERTIFLLYEQHWCIPWSNTMSDETFISKFFQLLFQFVKLCWSHSVRRNRNRLGILKEINSKVNFPFKRDFEKISGNSQTTGIDSRDGVSRLESLVWTRWWR